MPVLLCAGLLAATLLPAIVTARIEQDPPCETVVTCPPDLWLTTPSSRATAIFSVTATNPCVPDLSIQCYLDSPTSGHPVFSGGSFPVGTSTVVCVARSPLGGQSGECSFRVVVTRDAVPPQLLVPPRIIVPCTEPRGAVVDYTAAVFDNMDPAPSVTCVPSSGSLFAVGSNLVTCTAVDAAGNRTVKQFHVIVGSGCEGGGCLELVAPDDLVVPCTGPDGAVVEFAGSAINSCSGEVLPVTYTPPSGSHFPVGLTRVVCTASAGDLEGAATFFVQVTDTEAPQLVCPSHILVDALSPLGAAVEYSVSAVDNCTAVPRIRCSPPSGSVFPVGDTRVLCEAADDSGNLGLCSFVVSVSPPPPLSLAHLGSGRLELCWTGDAILERAARIGEEADWTAVNKTPEGDIQRRLLRLSAPEPRGYFRLRPLPVIPPMDRDGDGVPDAIDRCPDSQPGIPVDETGCGLSDLLATPARVLAPERERLRALRTGLLRWPGTERLFDLIPAADDAAVSLETRLFERDFSSAHEKASQIVHDLEEALAGLERTRVSRIAEMDHTAPILDAEHADVRNEDHELMAFANVEAALTDSLVQYRRVLAHLSDIVRALGGSPVPERVMIQSLDSARGIAVLADGRRIFLPRPSSAAAPPPGSIADALAEGGEALAVLSTLPDGSIYAETASSVLGVSSTVVHQVDPRRLALRVTPVDFGLPSFDLAERHYLEAYRWGFTENLSRHYLEFNQAFAATGIFLSVAAATTSTGSRLTSTGTMTGSTERWCRSSMKHRRRSYCGVPICPSSTRSASGCVNTVPR